MSFFEGTNPCALRDILAEIQGMAEFSFEAMLASHGLPMSADSPLLRHEYEASMAWRQTRLWREIKRIMGVSTAAALEVNEHAK
jgi:hypothetical protein